MQQARPKVPRLRLEDVTSLGLGSSLSDARNHPDAEGDWTDRMPEEDRGRKGYKLNNSHRLLNDE
jgi:hypothetical protein